MTDISSLSMTEIIRLQTRLQEELKRRFERPLAMVFSDIVGSTPYFARFGDSAGRQLQQMHLDLLAAALAGTGGRVVSTAGDGAFLAFDSVSAAVSGVMSFLRRCTAANQGRGREHQMQVRIGLHWGQVLTDGVDISGDAVNLCARVAAAADPGALWLTRAVFQELDRADRLNCRRLGEFRLKGFEQAIEVLALEWRDPVLFPRSLLVEETQDHVQLPQQDIVCVGRLASQAGAVANDVVLKHSDSHLARQVSRWHFELHRSEHGLRLVALADGNTTVDGQTVNRGAAVAVRAGTRIGVAGVLHLRLLGPGAPSGEVDDGATMMVVNSQAPEPTGAPEGATADLG